MAKPRPVAFFFKTLALSLLVAAPFAVGFMLGYREAGQSFFDAAYLAAAGREAAVWWLCVSFAVTLAAFGGYMREHRTWGRNDDGAQGDVDARAGER